MCVSIWTFPRFSNIGYQDSQQEREGKILEGKGRYWKGREGKKYRLPRFPAGKRGTNIRKKVLQVGCIQRARASSPLDKYLDKIKFRPGKGREGTSRLYSARASSPLDKYLDKIKFRPVMKKIKKV